MTAWKFFRTLMLVTSVAAALAVSLWLQRKFDAADRKNALAVVLDYRSKAGWTVPEVIEERHPGKHVVWGVTTESSCQQHERITADVDDAHYAFDVDINGPSIHPGNVEGEGILGELDKPRPASATSASAAPTSSASAAPPEKR